jgi:hypothetical protein
MRIGCGQRYASGPSRLCGWGFSPTLAQWVLAMLTVAATVCFAPAAASFTHTQCQSRGALRAATGTHSTSCSCGSLWFTIGSPGPSCVSRTTNGCVSWTGDCNTYRCTGTQCSFSYSSWACSTSCGTGSLRRTRTCRNFCTETSTEWGSSCTAGPAAAWTSWGPWSSCGVCGGWRTRTQVCAANCHGSFCSASSWPIGSTYTDWGSCSVTGTQTIASDCDALIYT